MSYESHASYVSKQLKGTPHWLEISNIGPILEIYWTNIGDFINKFPINLQYWSNIGQISSQCGVPLRQKNTRNMRKMKADSARRISRSPSSINDIPC